MIGRITGTVVEKDQVRAVVDVGGIGYEVFLPSSALAKLPELGGRVTIHTHLHVREDILQLYGFASPADKELFESLISVNGIGPKVALAVLSVFSAESLKRAVAVGDVDLITSVPGVGKKGANRLVLELKDRLGLPDIELPGGDGSRGRLLYGEVRAGLEALGYGALEAKEALDGVQFGDGASAESLLREALRKLKPHGRGKTGSRQD